MSSDVTLAIVTAGLSLLVSIASAIVAYILKRSNDRLGEQLKEREAQRDYRYDAKKRLYAEFQPLLFQLVELSENAYSRIEGLARTAAAAETVSPLLGGRSYLSKSTMYRLIAPIAVLKLGQERLTLVDFTVEPVIRFQYSLARQLYISLTEGSELAKIQPALPYDPYAKRDTPDFRYIPAVHNLQHLWLGDLDKLLDAMTVREADKPPRLLTWGQFDKEFTNKRSYLYKSATEIEPVFAGLHPQSTPILWRILVTHATIYQILKRFARQTNQTSSTKDVHLKDAFSIENQLKDTFSIDDQCALDWRPPASPFTFEQAVTEPLVAARLYLERYSW
jgi:hypothetical protein